VLPRLPTTVIERVLAWLTTEPWQSLAVERYARMFDVAALLVAPPEAPVHSAARIAGT
jgi:hypothetical protein